MPYVDARDGTKLHVKDMGTGEPVLLIHGWPLTGDMFEYQTLALLEAGYRVITYDRRGFGQSEHPATGYDYDMLADDLAAVIDGCGLDSVNLVGFSMGGGELARYLSRHGAAKVRRAALVGAVVPYLRRADDNPHGVDESVLETMIAQVREDRFAFLRSFAKQFYGVGFVSSPVSDALLDWSFLLGVMASPRATIECIKAFGYTDFRPDLPAFAGVPTLIMHGTADKVVPIDASARAAAEGIPHAQLIEYEGEPHGLVITAAEQVNEDLLSFLANGGVPA
ncbi:alpha/beta fold hydrolase [Sphingomonas quercus]|uniref:Alpha/beta hydrolase n=1 Tax=Sphingomonas quercus TaxID=2842451 RepID=A0ABS6BLN1_9SPHN|nr:alpha/beta hydrolase [Sphingomonas quercus]MBU3079228.1 alpha/beta hydrolase [Sphingomonas quercus]